MTYSFYITAKARDDLKGLDAISRTRILKKLKFFAAQPTPLRFAKKLTDAQIGQYRFRVGDYRVLFDLDKQNRIIILIILAVRHRREAYQN